MVYHLEGYCFLISKLMVDGSDENEVTRKAGKQAGLGRSRLPGSSSVMLGSGVLLGTVTKHLLLADTEEETSSNCPSDGKMDGSPGCCGWGQVSKSCYLTLSLPTFFNGPWNFCSHSVLLMPAMRSQFWVDITRVLKLSRNPSNFFSILHSKCKPQGESFTSYLSMGSFKNLFCIRKEKEEDIQRSIKTHISSPLPSVSSHPKGGREVICTKS